MPKAKKSLAPGVALKRRFPPWEAMKKWNMMPKSKSTNKNFAKIGRENLNLDHPLKTYPTLFGRQNTHF